MFAQAPDIRNLQAACSAFINACKCPLCDSPWRKASTFPCGHTFCYDCAIATLEGPGISQSECPTCKGKYWKRDLKPNPQIMAVVEHTQRILSIAALQVAGDAGHAGDEAAATAAADRDWCKSRGGAERCSGASDEVPLAREPSRVEGQAPRACNGAAVVPAAAGQVQSFCADWRAGAGMGSRGLDAVTLGQHRAAPLQLPSADNAVEEPPELEQALVLRPEAVDAPPGYQKGSRCSVPVPQWDESQQRDRAAAREPEPGPGGSWVQGVGQVQEPVHCKGPDLAPMESITPNAATDGTVGVLPYTAPVIRTLDPLGYDAPPPGVTGQGAQLADGVFLWVGPCEDHEAGRQSGSLASARYGVNEARPVGTAAPATPVTRGAGLAGRDCLSSYPAGASAFAAVVTPPGVRLLPQPRLQAGAGWAATLLSGRHTVGTGTGGSRQPHGSVMSIRRDTPSSLNDAYLSFHALLEKPLKWACRPRPSCQRSSHADPAASSHGDDEACASSWVQEFSEVDVEGWLRSLEELVGPTDQEREALEVELGMVSMFLEELRAMMVSEQQAVADGCTAATAGMAACGEACSLSFFACLGSPGGQVREAPRADGALGVDLHHVALACTVQDDEGPPKRQGQITAPAALDGFRADQLASLAALQQSQSRPHQATQSQLSIVESDPGKVSLSNTAVQPACARGVEPKDRAAAICAAAASECGATGAAQRDVDNDADNIIQEGVAYGGERSASERENRNGQQQPTCHGGCAKSRPCAVGSAAAAACAGFVRQPSACEAALRGRQRGAEDDLGGDVGARCGVPCKRVLREAASPGQALPPASIPPIRTPEAAEPLAAAASAQGHAQAGPGMAGPPLESPLGPSAVAMRAAGLVPGHNQRRGTAALCVRSRGGGGSNDAAAPAAAEICQASACPGGSAAQPGGSANAGAQRAPAAEAPWTSSPAPCPQWPAEGQGLDGAAPGAGAAEAKAAACGRRDRVHAKRHRAEPIHKPLKPLPLNSQPEQPQQQQQQQQHARKATAGQRQAQARRAKARERGLAAEAAATATLPPPAPVSAPGQELTAPTGATARRAKPLYVLPSGLGPEERARMKELTRSVRGLELLNDVQPQLTHLVVQLNMERRAVGRTIKYLRAVIQGCWVVGMDWVDACLAASRLLPEGPFEAAGDTTHAGTPATTRLRLERGDPPLFSGLKFCVMYLKGSFDGGITKPELEALLLAAGGTLVRRPTHRAGGGGGTTAAAARVTAAAALFGAAAAADLYDASLCSQQLTPQAAEGERDAGGMQPPPTGFPQVLVLVAAQAEVDVSRVIREWGCVPVLTQWVYDCISHYHLLPLENFAAGPQSHSSPTDMV